MLAYIFSPPKTDAGVCTNKDALDPEKVSMTHAVLLAVRRGRLSCLQQILHIPLTCCSGEVTPHHQRRGD